MIQELQEAGVIKEVKNSSPYCSRGTFIPKPNKVGLCLVTDYRAVNKILKRPSWPFYSSDSIRRQIQSTSRYFTAIDLLQSYHQVPLHKYSRDITTFIVAQGKFQFKRTPMGLTNSGDFLNQLTDSSSIWDLGGVMKLVDDCLAQAETLNDLKVILRALFTRCRTFNIIISTKKFQVLSLPCTTANTTLWARTKLR